MAVARFVSSALLLTFLAATKELCEVTESSHYSVPASHSATSISPNETTHIYSTSIPTLNATLSSVSPTLNATLSSSSPTLNATLSSSSPTLNATLSSSSPTLNATLSSSSPTLNATLSSVSPTLNATLSSSSPAVAITLSVCIPLVVTAITSMVVVAILIITRKKKMYDMTVMKQSSEIEMKAISNAMYGKFEGSNSAAPIHCETEMNESKTSDYALPDEIRRARYPKSTPVGIACTSSSKKLSTQYSELEEAVCTSPISIDDYNYADVHHHVISVRSSFQQAPSSIRSSSHVVPSSARSSELLGVPASTQSPLHPQVPPQDIGSLGPGEKEYLAPPPDEMKLYEQFSSMGLKVLARESIEVVGHLGSGQFGTVDKGVWQSHLGSMEVAIKTLNNGTTGNDRVKFLQEAAIMGQFSHPNVVKMYGIVSDGEPMMMVLELLDKGDLKGYVSSLRISHTAAPANHLASILLTACAQISSGMCYLANKGFVHRDLAARNILVSGDDQCKIADFVWAPCTSLLHEPPHPQALHYKKYSTASDVWSFGCVLFEIWSLGEKPFEAYSAGDTMHLVESGYRLPPPPGCPRGIYNLMIQCWHPLSSSRPAFITLCQALTLTKDALLRWSSEDRRSHSQATVLGAPLECGQDLYQDLQRKYCNFRSSFV
eukprot:Em0020g1049a